MRRSPPPTPPAPRPTPAAGEGRVYMLRLWTAAPTRGGFQALVRPVESEHWLGFTEPAALLAFLLRPEAVSREEP